MKAHVIHTPDAPRAIGPYVQAVFTGNFLFLSGQIGIDPATGQLLAGDVSKQTERALQNLKAVLGAAGAHLSQVVKTTVFLADINEFQQMNEVYGRFFDNWKPARSTVEVSRLPLGARVEIEAIAVVEEEPKT